MNLRQILRRKDAPNVRARFRSRRAAAHSARRHYRAEQAFASDVASNAVTSASAARIGLSDDAFRTQRVDLLGREPRLLEYRIGMFTQYRRRRPDLGGRGLEACRGTRLAHRPRMWMDRFDDQAVGRDLRVRHHLFAAMNMGAWNLLCLQPL